MADNQLNREDLFLLMESYRNMIEMHSTLVEQQKQIIDLQNTIANKQDVICSNQSKNQDYFDRVTEKLGSCIDLLSKTNEVVKKSSENVEDFLSDKMEKLNDKISDNKVDSMKEHSGINTRIYVSMGAMVTIIISLIGIIMMLVDKFDMIQDSHEILESILKYFTPSN